MRYLKLTVATWSLVLAVSAIGSTSAWASEPPEIGRCVSKTGGKFLNNVCTKQATGTNVGKYEWEPGAIHKKFTASSGTAVLETHGRVKVECKHEAATGELTSPKTAGNINVTFTECKEALEHKCTSAGAAEGEIKTATLAGELVWEKKPKKTALRLFPQSGSFFASFVCGPAPSEVKENSHTGGILVPVRADKSETKVEEKFVAKGGVQKPDAYYNAANEKIPCFLEAKIGGSVFEQAGQTEVNIEVDEEPLEVNTTVYDSGASRQVRFRQGDCTCARQALLFIARRTQRRV